MWNLIKLEIFCIFQNECTYHVAIVFNDEGVVPFRPESISLLTLAYFTSWRPQRNYSRFAFDFKHS